MRLRNFLVAGIFLLLLFLEEEEEKSEYYKDVPQTVDELKKWADEFHKRVHYPLYGIVLATGANSEAISFVQNYRAELARISGQDCCFIYFRDLNRAKDLADFFYSEEQMDWVHQIADLAGIGHLPGFLFFEQIDSGEYVYISLKGLSQEEILDLAREMFTYASRGKRKGQLTKFKGFKRLYRIKTLGRRVGRYTIEIGKEAAVELIKSFASIMSKGA